MESLPNFNSQFLNECVKSFSKVRKSLKHSSQELKINKIIEVREVDEFEKIELVIRASLSRNGIRVRLHVWDDRWIWIDARKSVKNGWEWEHNIEGRLSGHVTERDLMKTLKTFYKETFLYVSETAQAMFDNHWKAIVAQGPKDCLEVRK